MMKKLTKITTFIAVFGTCAVPAFADTLILKSGRRLTGYLRRRFGASHQVPSE